MSDIKKRKNPWHTRRVNKRYKEINKEVQKDSDVELKTNSADEALKTVINANEKIVSMKNQYADILNKNRKSAEELYDALPIESLKDLFDVETLGKPTKPQYSDITKAAQIKKEGQKIIESKDSLVASSKIAEIELLQAKIEAIINISNKKEDKKNEI